LPVDGKRVVLGGSSVQNKTQEEREKKKAIEAGFVYIYIPFSLPKNIKIKIQQSTLVYRREQ